MPAIVRHTIHQFNNSLLEKKRNITSLDEHLDCKIYSKSRTLRCKRKKESLFLNLGISPSSAASKSPGNQEVEGRVTQEAESWAPVPVGWAVQGSQWQDGLCDKHRPS